MTNDMLQTSYEDTADPVVAAFPGRRPAIAAEDAALRSVIESAVLPRLRMAFSRSNSLRTLRPSPLMAAVDRTRPARDAAGSWVADDDVVSQVAERLINNDTDGVMSLLDVMRTRGRSLAHIYLGVLMPAAVRLDDLRAADICGSAASTLAFCNLQGLLRRYSPDFYAEAGQVHHTGLRALLAAPSTGLDGAGLQVFGLLLASELFRREGWDAWTERSLDSPDFKGTVRGQWFDLVEVLANSDTDLDAIAAGIKLIRRGAPNPGVGIVACGRVFQERPELVRLIGADLAAADVLSSLSHAHQLVSRPSPRRRLS